MRFLLLQTLLVPIFALVVAGVRFESDPVLWLVVAAVAGTYLVIIVRYLLRVSSALAPSKPAEQRVSEVTDAATDYFLARIGLTLLIAVAAMVAILVWGLSQPR